MPRLNRRHVQLALAFGCVTAWACVGVSPGEGGDAAAEHQELRAEILASVADNVLAPRHAAFDVAAAELESATESYAAAVQAGDEAEVAADRDAAREAWRSAMRAWQVAEQLQLGPAGSSLSVIAGEDLRDEVYSWPSVNTCRIDQELVLGEYGESDFQATRLVNVYGLDAVEYLLFWDGPDNTCAPQLPINQDGEWAALGDAEVMQRRADYAAVLAANVASTADELGRTWADEGDFNGWLRAPGEGASPYASVDEAMDELMRAMFYADLVLKDEKLAKPIGLLDCGSDTCVESLESAWANMSKEAVASNLAGLRELFLGGSSADAGTGFDDLLAEMGEQELAEELLAAIDGAIARVDAVDGDFREALLADPDALDDVYDAVKRVTDLLKGDFAATLTLSIPNEGAGDAD